VHTTIRGGSRYYDGVSRSDVSVIVRAVTVGTAGTSVSAAQPGNLRDARASMWRWACVHIDRPLQPPEPAANHVGAGSRGGDGRPEFPHVGPAVGSAARAGELRLLFDELARTVVAASDQQAVGEGIDMIKRHVPTESAALDDLESWGVVLPRGLSARQRRAIVARGSLQLGLLALALNDLRSRDRKQLRGPKLVWAAVCCVNYLGAGPLLYLLVGRRLSAPREIRAR
jgi:hypothetical protein